MGFGVSVIQRLCKTAIKKNLYYEIKDKVIEEAFDGFRTIKKSAKVKVYGTDSNKEVRARLIEILYDRVRMHKDKFIAPILHHEMESMEVKKNGKVEHSQNSHDDQVFSYLMALRVWYDGIDIMERYGIQKNTIKTDEDIDVETLSIDNNMYGGMSSVDVDTIVRELNESDTELEQQLQYIKQAESAKLAKDYNEQRQQEQEDCLQQLLASNEAARTAYAKKNNLDLDDKTVGGIVNGTGFIELPDAIFGDIDIYDDEEEAYGVNRNIVGNLASHWQNLL